MQYRPSKARRNGTSSEAHRPDVYSRVTEQVIAHLERGVRPWIKPWRADHTEGRITRPLRFNGLPYCGINILMLWASARAEGFSAPTWMTFRQAKELGANVRKGEQGSLVVYANAVVRIEKTDDGDNVEREIPFLKNYTVFNVEQIEGLPEQYYAEPQIRFTPVERIAHADAFFAATQADLRHRGHQAFYSQASDYIQLPPVESFVDIEAYYSTLAHEVVHWTKHPSRLNRDFGRKQFADDGYAREELVAELGAAFLAADLEITTELREDHASYLDHWLKILKADKRAIFHAAAHAQRAAEYVHSLQSAAP
jgi:antirestriction protein ArdC